MCDCNYVYCVMNTSDPTPVGLRVFSTWQKADEYRKVLKEKNLFYSDYYVETLEVD
jgi:hypothetical protein